MMLVYLGWTLGLLACNKVAVDEDALPTFHADVQPITEGVCARCHSGDGVGPFPLTTFEEVTANADAVVDSVVSGRMPPWLAADGCNDYVGDFSLSPAEVDTLVRWVDGGTPKGDPADTVDIGAVPDGALPRVDHTITLPEPYLPAEGEDDYRCFVLDWPDPAVVTSVTGFRVNPDNDATVHHVIAYVVPPNWADAYDALDGEDGRPGYTCFGSLGGPAEFDPMSDEGPRWLGGWAPGGVGADFPEGTGIPVEAGSRIVIQVHYHLEDGVEPAPDQSSIEVMVDPTVPFSNWALILPFTNEGWVDSDWMEIPASTDSVSHSFSLPMDQPFIVHSVGLHMHTLGRSARLQIDRSDGSDCLLDIPRWDFEWQRQYELQAPTSVAMGDALTLECTWDNPTDQDVYWGDGTNDEMCLGTLYVTSP